MGFTDTVVSTVPFSSPVAAAGAAESKTIATVRSAEAEAFGTASFDADGSSCNNNNSGLLLLLHFGRAARPGPASSRLKASLTCIPSVAC